VVIAGYVRHGFAEDALNLFYQMQQNNIQPDQFTFASVLPACAKLGALEQGMAIHDEITRNGFQFDLFVGRALIDLYAKCGRVEKARDVFDKMPQRDAVSWNAMIAGYVQNGHVDEALQFFRNMPERNVVSWNTMIAAYAKDGPFEASLTLYYEMQLAGIQPNHFTFASVLPACAELGNLKQGKEIHEEIVRCGYQSDVFVANALIDMYAKCGNMEKARDVFDKMPQRDVVSWNAIIGGYAQNGHVDEALKIFQKMPEQNMVSWNTMIAAYVRDGLCQEALTLFYQMRRKGIQPNEFTFASVLPACARLEALEQGMEIHEEIIRCEYQFDIFVGNALVNMYAKCGCVGKAWQLFQEMHCRDVVSWNAMLAGYAHNGHFDEALEVFQEMQLAGVKPDTNTFSSVLSACSSLADLEQGMEIHQEIIRSGFQLDVSVGSALVDMYVKCGNIEQAHDVFKQMPLRNAISWTAMIAGYSLNGHAMEALRLFREMVRAGVEPDSKAFVSVLPACANLGALVLGMEIHEHIIRNGLQEDVFAASALVDMYAKCGDIDKSRHLFDKMQERNVVSWTSMISGYAIHGYGKEAIELFEQMQHSGLKPNHVTLVCILSACCHAGLVDTGRRVFESMSEHYQITPTMDHYSCMVDLLARSGHLDEAHEFINRMPLKPDATVWACLLGACRIHNNVELGNHVAEQLFKSDLKDAAPYVLLSNMYATAGRWEGIEKVRKMMKDRKVKKNTRMQLD
jgi:pentatricopeptide repeat protein